MRNILEESKNSHIFAADYDLQGIKKAGYKLADILFEYTRNHGV